MVCLLFLLGQGVQGLVVLLFQVGLLLGQLADDLVLGGDVVVQAPNRSVLLLLFLFGLMEAK